jgi:cobalt-zinc-cadmium efflux system membrane fusion protein
VRAPFDGVAVELLANLGARVETLDPVFRVADLNTLWLEIHVPQERASRMRPQQQFAAVVVDGHTIEASLAHVGQVVDTGSQTVMTRAVADNSDGRLRAGQVLPARIFSRSSAETGTVVTIPATSVVRDSGQEYVFVRVGEGFAVRQITLVAEDAESAYVGSGLEPQSEIAFAGVAVLKSIWFENRSLEETP